MGNDQRIQEMEGRLSSLETELDSTKQMLRQVLNLTLDTQVALAKALVIINGTVVDEQD